MKIAPTLPSKMRLDELPPRTCAVIRRIETGSEEMQRLQSLGVCVGRQIEIIKSGDPLIVRVFGSHLGLAASLASHVWLEVCEPSHCAFQKISDA
jgi:Fe2+ transport system protein FeoA